MAEALATVVNEDRHSWANRLPEVNLTYNSSFHESFGDIPYRVVFKEPPGLVTDVAADRVQPSLQDKAAITCPKSYTDSLQGDTTTIYCNVTTSVEAATARQRQHHQPRIHHHSFLHAGDNVLLRRLQRRLDHAKCLYFPWTGPYVVLRRSSPVNYVIRLSDGGRN